MGLVTSLAWVAVTCSDALLEKFYVSQCGQLTEVQCILAMRSNVPAWSKGISLQSINNASYECVLTFRLGELSNGCTLSSSSHLYCQKIVSHLLIMAI